MIQENYRVIGVMSGTSLDGVDLAVCRFNFSETIGYAIEEAITIPYPLHWKTKLKEAVSFSSEMLSVLDVAYTQYLADLIQSFIKEYRLENIDAVCSHGHTILHQPEAGVTLQIGNLKKISEIIGITVVCNFRVQDVGLGGQGAPLVPIGDRLLFNEYDYCLNLGGFANVSCEQNGTRIAYDICPVNIVMNAYAEKAGKPYDENGNLAKSGSVLLETSNQLRNLHYYKLPAPKSLGLEYVLEEVFPILNETRAAPEDILRTFTDHIAEEIARQFKRGSRVLVTGGGAYNGYLLSQIKENKEIELVVPDSTLLEFKEALIFGLLGTLRLRDEINCLASVTGASQDHSSGEVFRPLR